MSVKLVLLSADPRYPEEFAKACLDEHLGALTEQVIWDCLAGITYRLTLPLE